MFPKDEKEVNASLVGNAPYMKIYNIKSEYGTANIRITAQEIVISNSDLRITINNKN